MHLHRGSMIMIAMVLGCLALVSAGAADETVSSRVPVPDIPGGRGENCVADTAFMRRNHMTLLMHQRDDTVLQGIRDKRYSLKECVSCHAVEGPDAVVASFASEKHFCRACHDYAAVDIDCFECHASRPDTAPATGDHGGVLAGAK